jgi:hypothetical protein
LPEAVLTHTRELGKGNTTKRRKAQKAEKDTYPSPLSTLRVGGEIAWGSGLFWLAKHKSIPRRNSHAKTEKKKEKRMMRKTLQREMTPLSLTFKYNNTTGPERREKERERKC